VSFPGELENQRAVIEEVAKGSGVQYKVGTMLETPRAAMDAETIAQHADFFSVGSNDLTQFGDGLSRDDGGRMIRKYLDNGILAHDPFQVLDQSGVGELIRTAFERGRKGNPQLILGLCTPSSLFMLLSRDAPVCTQCR
jgi:pyruvate,orthophosphate dikinase